jgi:hypothetical protein
MDPKRTPPRLAAHGHAQRDLLFSRLRTLRRLTVAGSLVGAAAFSILAARESRASQPPPTASPTGGAVAPTSSAPSQSLFGVVGGGFAAAPTAVPPVSERGGFGRQTQPNPSTGAGSSSVPSVGSAPSQTFPSTGTVPMPRRRTRSS